MMSLEFDDNLKTYNPGKESHRSVMWLRDRPFRAATFCLGLLCVLLLIGIIILVHSRNQDQSIPGSKLNGTGQVMALTASNNNLTMEKDGLKISNNKLIQELDQLQTSKNNVTEERNQLKTGNNHLLQERDQLQNSNNHLTQERDQLQTSNKNLSKEAYKLNVIKTLLTKEKELLRTSNDNMIQEMDQLHSSKNNLTQERDLLQTKYKNLTMEMVQLQTINNHLTQERDLLQTNNDNLTMEMYQLQDINKNLTQERDRLEELQRLNGSGVTENPNVCQFGWHAFGGSCYFLSSEKKSWQESRNDCLKKNADLVVIHSKEDQKFMEGFCCAVWIGLTDKESESKWKWVDGSPFNFKFWSPNEPNNAGNEDCAEMLPITKSWNDVPCSERRNWACKKMDV